MPRLFPESRSVVVGLLTFLLVLSGATLSTAQAAAGTVGVDMVINTSGVESTSATIPSGGKKLHVIKYSCNGADCTGATITLPLADNVSIGAATFSSDWTQSRSGNVVTWSAEELAAGSSSQITFDLTVAASVVPDGTTVTHRATINALGAASSTTAPVSMTVRSGATTQASITRPVGGAVGAWTTYGVSACVRNLDDGSGPLGTQAGSRLVLTLPDGAVVRENGTGTLSGSTVTWTLGGVGGGSCADQVVRVEFPAGSTNTVGTTKTATVVWTGALVGRSSGTLGTDTNSFSLAAQTAGSGGTISEDIGTATPQFDDPQPRTWTGVSGSNALWDDLVIDSDLSEAITPSSIHGTTGRTPGRLYVSVDGGPLVLAAEASANSGVTLDPYATWPNGAPALASTQTITRVRWEFGGLQPGDGGGMLGVASSVRRTTVGGDPISVGDTFAVPSTVRIQDHAGGDRTLDLTKSFTITQPVPTITMRAGGGGSVPRGSTNTFESIGFIGADALVNPVMAIRIPAQLSYVAGSGQLTGGTAGLTDPTITAVPNWAGVTGQTLLRLTWPQGYTIPRDAAVRFVFDVAMIPKAFDNKQLKMFMTSRTGAYNCGDPWFVEADTADVDGNGDTSKTLCAWGADVSPSPDVQAQVVQSVKGSWDSDYQAGPATSYTSPGSEDSLRTSLVNSGNIRLTNAAVITKLPRPGDRTLLTDAARNPTTSTFPVLLDGAPQLPSGLTGVTTSWTSQDLVCLPDIASSPGDCDDPVWHDWSTDAPTDPNQVTYLRFDFGGNVLVPYTSWDIDLPVTTPTSGATEPDFAVANPDPRNPAADERAVATSAATVTRTDLSSRLTPVESTPVTLQLPGSGGPYAPPAPQTRTSTGVWGTPQTTTVTVPAGGSVVLLDADGDPVPSNRREVAGEGVYVLNPATGVITFTGAAGHVGRSTVSFTVTDRYAASAEGTYTPRVTPPAAPAPGDVTSTGPVGAVQHHTLTPPSGGSVYLVDRLTLEPIVSDTLTVAGEGVYTVNRATGVLTFTPEADFHGIASSASLAARDSLGQVGFGTYTATVTLPAAPVAGSRSTTGAPGQVQRTTVTVPTGGSLSLWDGTSPVSSLVVPDQGTYRVDGSDLVFEPLPDFVGSAAPVSYQVTDRFDQVGRSTYQATVDAPGGAAAGSASPTTVKVRKGVPVTLSPLAHVVPPTGETVRADTLRIGLAPRSATRLAVRTGAGLWQADAQGRVRFTPASGFVGVSTVYFQVTASDGSVLRSSLSVVVTGTVSGTLRTTVYFGVRSARLDAHDRQVLRRLAAQVPDRATTSALAVGYVQPERYRANDARLSRARGRNVATAMQRMVALKRVVVSGKGRARQQGWRARRATVALSWSVTQR